MRAATLYTKIIGAEHTEVVVFLPGFTGSHVMWNRDFQALGARYKLVFVDALGFGRSPKPDIDYSITEHLDAINYTLRALNIANVHMVGYSLGALLALAYAVTFPEQVTKLGLLALPLYHSEQEARERIKRSSLFNRLLALDTPLAHVACTLMCYFRPLLQHVVPLFARDVPAVVARDALQHTWASYSRTLRQVIFKPRAEEWLRRAQHPTLLLHGTYDRIAPIEHAQRAIDSVPNARLVALEAGHRLAFTHSAALSAQLAAFLQG